MPLPWNKSHCPFAPEDITIFLPYPEKQLPSSKEPEGCSIRWAYSHRRYPTDHYDLLIISCRQRPVAENKFRYQIPHFLIRPSAKGNHDNPQQIKEKQSGIEISCHSSFRCIRIKLVMTVLPSIRRAKKAFGAKDWTPAAALLQLPPESPPSAKKTKLLFFLRLFPIVLHYRPEEKLKKA